MSNINIRVAHEQDAEELHSIMQIAFTPLRELGIDWPSVHADLEMVKDNLRQNTTFVLENEKKLFQRLRFCYAWSSVNPFQVIRSFGGLQHDQLMMDKGMGVNF